MSLAGRPLHWIVTRPAAQAAGWVKALQALGQPAQALPLLDIAPLADPAPIHAAWAGLAANALVVFVSANAVEHFHAQRPEGARWPEGTLAGSTGPGTSAALQAAGLDAAVIVDPGADAPVYDSEALWARLQHCDWRGRQALVVRGEEGRDWLADALRAAGAEVNFVAAYRRVPPRPGAEGLALLQRALAHPGGHVWLFSSSEAVGHLGALVPDADWSASQAVASHPRIAQAARQLGFGRVGLAAPRPADALACLAAWKAELVAAPQLDDASCGGASIQSPAQ